MAEGKKQQTTASSKNEQIRINKYMRGIFFA